ncbi:MAG: phage/plasmid primase, P4 family [Desulfobacteraceae bacterium]|jgi:putative DNA primase/helicase
MAEDKEQDSIQALIEERVKREKEALKATDKKPAKKALCSKFVTDCLRANELGDGILYAEIHDGKFLFDKTTNEWLKWAGHHWGLDIMDSAKSSVEKVAQTYLKEAFSLTKKIDDAIKNNDNNQAKKLTKRQTNIYKRVLKLRSEKGRTSCLKFAQTNPINAISIDGSELDKDPWLLACPNGVVNLRTGELRDGRPSDNCFRACNIEYHGIDAKAPVWEIFLNDVFEKKEDIIKFVLRIIGYGMTGLNFERIMPVFCGSGWNGKGTILETIMKVCGSYASPIQSEMLLDSGRMVRSASGVSPDIMQLKGLRLALASETDEGRRFSTSKVKWLTGGDTLVGRNPYDKRPSSFTPTHMLILITNHEPKAPAHDYAFWKRVYLIRFNLSFVDNPKLDHERPRDKELIGKLSEEMPGILASFVRGCIEWQKDGLNPPKDVLKETLKYKRSLDNLSDFFDECCLVQKDNMIGAKELYDAFVEWWEINVSKNAPKQKTFGNWMSNAGFERIKSGTYKYVGLTLEKEVFDE